jgi:Heterokaryon incompatibility protein (HET)
MIFTRKLRIRYLWIDSLCIIQDDKEDWRKESAMMCSVFQGSTLTLCATASPDSRGGLFFKASTDEQGHMIGNRQDGETQWEVYLRRPIPHFDFFEGSKNSEKTSPLLKRAWVFQERLLAPRLLHFGPQELIWECAEEMSCECSGIEVTQPKKSYAWGLRKGSAEHIRDMWHGLVASYTGLQLTFGHDRLPALAGLAKQFQDYKRGRYLAGLWEDTLVEDLLWHIDFPSARPEKWRAPSWSWASVDNEASYLYVRDGVQALCEVLRFQGTPLGLDSYGELSSAIITLAGLTAVVSHHGDSFENSFESEIHQFFVIKPGRQRSIRVDADYFWYRNGPSKVSDEYVYLFKLAKDPYYMYSLILRCVDSSSETYERIGIVRQSLADLAQDAELLVFDGSQGDALVNII